GPAVGAAPAGGARRGRGATLGGEPVRDASYVRHHMDAERGNRPRVPSMLRTPDAPAARAHPQRRGVRGRATCPPVQLSAVTLRAEGDNLVATVTRLLVGH